MGHGRVRFGRVAIVVVGWLVGSGRPAAAQAWPGRDRLEVERCGPESGDARSWLARADSAVGRSRLGDRVLTFDALDADIQFYQSDRTYPPFIGASVERRYWFDGATGVERFGPATAGPRVRDAVRTEHALYAARDTAIAPTPAAYQFRAAGRALNPLAVLADWSKAAGVRVVARCSFRDYPRLVLQRADGERLYLNLTSGAPVKLERIEPHYLWGQVRAEYVYATYWQMGPVNYPVVAVRYQDGVEHLRRDLALPQTQGAEPGAVVPRDSAPRLALPNGDPDHRTVPDVLAATEPVDTVRVGPNTILLSTRFYTHAATLIRDTVFLFDATTAEWRSRADSAIIARVFPGRHPTVLVVTDAAWPHIAGIRFWAARGARILTHPVAKPFVDQVLARRWTLAPDLLERTRGARAAVSIATAGGDLATGDVKLRAIDGVASEGALMAFLPSDGFLWASDYIQTVSEPSLYAREVAAAVRRAGFAPKAFAAQHVGLNPWPKVEAVVADR